MFVAKKRTRRNMEKLLTRPIHTDGVRSMGMADGIAMGFQPVFATARLTTPATMQTAPNSRAGAAFSCNRRAPKYVPINVDNSRAGATWLIGASCIAYSTRM